MKENWIELKASGNVILARFSDQGKIDLLNNTQWSAEALDYVVKCYLLTFGSLTPTKVQPKPLLD